MFNNRTKFIEINSQIQIIDNINSALSKDTNIPNNMTDALLCAKKAGYIVENISNSGTSNLVLLWDSKNDCICYLDEDNDIKYTPDTNCKYSIEDKTMVELYYWEICSTV